MPAPASIDLRQRVVDAYEAGEGSLREIADAFHVHFRSVHQWVKRFRATGSVAPKPHAGGPPAKIAGPRLAVLRELVDAQRDATLAELCARFETRTGLAVSDTTVCDALRALDLPRKKSRRTRASSTARTSRAPARSSRSHRR